MSNINSEQLAKMDEKMARLRKAKSAANTSTEYKKVTQQIAELEAKMKAMYKSGQLSEADKSKPKMNQGGMAKKFKPCAGCPTPSACMAAGKCAKGGYAKGGMAKKASGYNKGGYVNCGASMKPTQKGTK